MNKQKTFFTSDHHFFHQNIIGYCDRPFLSSDEMDEHMIESWNEAVSPGDMVYHLGDFAITGYSKKFIPKVEKILKKLNGSKILIRGNHDASPVLKAEGWSAIHDIHYLKLADQIFILCHYSMRTWQFKGKGAIHLYGHSHNNLPSLDRSMDVGVDAMGYKPVESDRIISIMEKVGVGEPKSW